MPNYFGLNCSHCSCMAIIFGFLSILGQALSVGQYGIIPLSHSVVVVAVAGSDW